MHFNGCVYIYIYIYMMSLCIMLVTGLSFFRLGGVSILYVILIIQ